MLRSSGVVFYAHDGEFLVTGGVIYVRLQTPNPYGRY